MPSTAESVTCTLCLAAEDQAQALLVPLLHAPVGTPTPAAFCEQCQVAITRAFAVKFEAPADPAGSNEQPSEIPTPGSDLVGALPGVEGYDDCCAAAEAIPAADSMETLETAAASPTISTLPTREETIAADRHRRRGQK